MTNDHIHTHNGMEECTFYGVCFRCHCHLQDEAHTACCKGAAAKEMYENRQRRLGSEEVFQKGKPNMFDSEDEQIAWAFEQAVESLIQERRRRLAPGEAMVYIGDLNDELLRHFFAEGFKWGREV